PRPLSPRISLLPDRSQLDAFVSAVTNPDRRAPTFIRPDDIRVLPRPVFDLFPGEDGVTPGSETLDAESAGLIGRRALVEVASLTIGCARHDGDLDVCERFLSGIHHRSAQPAGISADNDFQ